MFRDFCSRKFVLKFKEISFRNYGKCILQIFEMSNLEVTLKKMKMVIFKIVRWEEKWGAGRKR